MYWKKLPFKTIKSKIFEALENNLNYKDEPILGLPATYLDQEQFYFNAPFLKDAPFLSTLISNPNHIGCHTYSKGESYFSGTQAVEVDVLRICAEEILGAEPNSYDGYVAPGGTEANIQAQWIYRNYFVKEKKAKLEEIGLIFSEDVHYSAFKGCNILSIKPITIKIDKDRNWDLVDLEKQLITQKQLGIKYLIVHLTMATTMYGSIDVPGPIIETIKAHFEDYFVHVDAAFGGFIYPFTNSECQLTFKNESVSSITLDGHKMLQAPYGTGIFLARKGLMEYAQTEEASYVQGTDFTLCGSRSGANAVSMWMILMSHGSAGWQYQMERLIDRTDGICEKLDELNIPYYRNPYMNIVAMDAKYIPIEVAKKYHLVADDFNNPKWWKIVTMMHVKKHVIDKFLIDLQQASTVFHN
ncbi:aspartate aminotransferase family protein [Putridiphycobacter roseus]|uniref:Aspartate aminotransferase family protein n=1 Tax=Putridiphycobacter roseus TaxID=2219161 RepID=A0A2W1MX15_9FLAO|nr:pyridoxal-dependent decarboxylase [Putridiphycobacter roseus]PZE16427.1 aspartate aminotransferase family protein [Putridiphycobacter roseus]